MQEAQHPSNHAQKSLPAIINCGEGFSFNFLCYFIQT